MSMPMKSGPSMPLRLTVVADGLRDGEYVPLVEAAGERRAAVTGRAEADALLADGGVGPLGVVGRHQTRDVRQHRGIGRPSREGADSGPIETIARVRSYHAVPSCEGTEYTRLARRSAM